MINETKAQVLDVPGMFYKKVILYTLRPDNKIELNKGNTMVTLEPGAAARDDEYTFMATDEELRALYENLRRYFRVGKDETYVDGKLEQTEKHLNDMRVIALSNLKLDKHI